MMLNIFKIKRLVSYFIPSLFSLGTFIILIITGGGLLLSIVGTVFVGLALGYGMYRWTKHPVLAILEGEGLLVLTIDSKGVIRAQLARIIRDIDTVKLLLPNGKEILFKREELTYLMFGSDIGLPVILYNEVLGMPIKKEDLMEKEKLYLSHTALEIYHKVSELSRYMRDFARYIVEQMKPRRLGILGDWKTIIIIIIIILIIGVIVMTFLGGGGIVQTPQIAQPTTNITATIP